MLLAHVISFISSHHHVIFPYILAKAFSNGTRKNYFNFFKNPRLPMLQEPEHYKQTSESCFVLVNENKFCEVLIFCFKLIDLGLACDHSQNQTTLSISTL